MEGKKHVSLPAAIEALRSLNTDDWR